MISISRPTGNRRADAHVAGPNDETTHKRVESHESGGLNAIPCDFHAESLRPLYPSDPTPDTVEESDWKMIEENDSEYPERRAATLDAPPTSRTDLDELTIRV